VSALQEGITQTSLQSGLRAFFVLVGRKSLKFKPLSSWLLFVEFDAIAERGSLVAGKTVRNVVYFVLVPHVLSADGF
jgi:hypothetical protein